MLKCLNCGFPLQRKYLGDALIEYCQKCGYEKAIIHEEKTRQTTLKIGSIA